MQRRFEVGTLLGTATRASSIPVRQCFTTVVCNRTSDTIIIQSRCFTKTGESDITVPAEAR